MLTKYYTNKMYILIYVLVSVKRKAVCTINLLHYIIYYITPFLHLPRKFCMILSSHGSVSFALSYMYAFVVV